MTGLQRLTSLGIRPSDTAEERLQKATLNLAAVTITLLASLWVVIYWSYGLFVPALIPFVYQIFAIAGLAWFARTARFTTFRTLQLGLMLVLPVALQLSLGGFVNASGVMLWAFVTPLGAILFGARARGWFVAFAVLVVVTGLLDGVVAPRVPTLPETVRVPFFVLNVGAVCGTSFLLLRHAVRQRDRARAALEMERQRSEQLLLNILPAPIAERLKDGEEVIADRAEEVTVVFADIVGFTALAAWLPPEEVVEVLDQVFTRLDELTERYGLEKIKTIGDAYLAVSGLPEPQPDQTGRAADMALALCAEFESAEAFTSYDLQVRVGMETGPVVAGVIGRKRFAYDLWGDTVNTASRMESHGIPGRVQVTERVRDRLSDRYVFEPRGTVDVKGKGSIRTWFLVDRVRSEVRTTSRPSGDARP